MQRNIRNTSFATPLMPLISASWLEISLKSRPLMSWCRCYCHNHMSELLPAVHLYNSVKSIQSSNLTCFNHLVIAIQKSFKTFEDDINRLKTATRENQILFRFLLTNKTFRPSEGIHFVK